jgi:hypothetical protein
MAENKRNFWTTMPGIISGVAAIVTGLGVLIPLLLGAAGKHPNKNSASQNPTPGVTSTAGSGSPTSTAGTTDNGSPLPSDSSSPLPTSSSDSSSSPSGAAGIIASPSSVTFGSSQVGKATSDTTVSINNPGSAPVTIDKVEITGSNASAFTVTSTTCGNGATVASKESCTVAVRFTPPALGSASANLVVHYHPPQHSFTTIQLSGSGSIL